jgi:hypothetical protein
MAMQIQAGEISEMICNQTRGFERNLLPLGNLSTLAYTPLTTTIAWPEQARGR